MAKTDSVRAVFGGEELTFRLSRESLRIGLFEASARAGSYDILRACLAGSWTHEQLKAVLSFAHPLGFAESRESVERVLGNGAAVYSMLATKILEAQLFGIEEAEAAFDETKVEEPA